MMILMPITLLIAAFSLCSVLMKYDELKKYKEDLLEDYGSYRLHSVAVFHQTRPNRKKKLLTQSESKAFGLETRTRKV